MTSIVDVLHGLSRDEPRVLGVVVGRVTDNRDPEGLGRVMVAIPSLGDIVTSWARVAAPGAGKARGAWFLPEVDDEVLVAFEHGDVRFAYVLGGLWHRDAAPPEDVGGGDGADHRSITSRSGHVLRLDDKDGKETIEIVDKTGKNRIVITSSDNKLEITAEGDIVIASTNGNVSIEGKDVKISAKGTATVKANSKLELSASAQATLKGATVAIN